MESISTQIHQDSPEFRRNLSLAACQPCRKAKTGCDHANPCSRCIRRGLQHQCAYRTVEEQPAKAGGIKDGRDRTNTPLEQRLKQIERSLQNLQRQLQPEVSLPKPKKRRRDVADGTVRQSYSTTNDSIEDDIENSDNGDPSFIGPNSNITALQEFISTREEFKEILGTLPTEQAQQSFPLPAWAEASDGLRVRELRLHLGERILTDFPPKALCDELLRIYFDVFNHIRPIVPRKWANNALQEIFQVDGFMQWRTATNLPDIVARVESLSLKSTMDSNAPSSLVNWKNIGALSAMFAVAAYTSPDLLQSGAFQPENGSTRAESIRELVFMMKHVVGMCWELCNHAESPNESTVIFLYLYIFMLIVFGEYGPYISHLIGCLIKCTAEIDLHREMARDANNPEYIERRRTEYAAIYHLDKIHATFNGRPPLMFRQFSNTLLPSTGNAADRYLRGQFLIAQAREEVLELILTSPRSPSAEKIANLQKAVLDRYNSITPELKYDRNNPTAANNPSLNGQRIVLYLFSLENSFLVQSVARKRTKAVSETKLLKVSTVMFSAVVRMWDDRAEFSHFSFLFSWLLTSYAFAAAGIIFSAILKNHTVSDGKNDLLPVPLTSKSHHLAELGQFLDALISIPPTDPHIKACKKAFRIFSKVYEALGGIPPDTIFDPKSLRPEQTADLSGPPSGDSYSETGLNNHLSDFGALPWLDHVWMDFGDDLVQLSEDTDIPPFSGDVSFENWSNVL